MSSTPGMPSQRPTHARFMAWRSASVATAAAMRRTNPHAEGRTSPRKTESFKRHTKAGVKRISRGACRQGKPIAREAFRQCNLGIMASGDAKRRPRGDQGCPGMPWARRSTSSSLLPTPTSLPWPSGGAPQSRPAPRKHPRQRSDPPHPCHPSSVDAPQPHVAHLRDAG